MSEQLMILVAGPYRSGTNDDPVLIQRNVDAMEDMALAVFRRGHLPVLGEWFALPLLPLAPATVPPAPLPAAQSGNVAASLFALTMASISEHWPSAAMLGSLVVTVIVAAVATPCPSASNKAAPAMDQAIRCCNRCPLCRKHSGKAAPKSVERARRRWSLRRAPRGKARRSA